MSPINHRVTEVLHFNNKLCWLLSWYVERREKNRKFIIIMNMNQYFSTNAFIRQTVERLLCSAKEIHHHTTNVCILLAHKPSDWYIFYVCRSRWSLVRALLSKWLEKCKYIFFSRKRGRNRKINSNCRFYIKLINAPQQFAIYTHLQIKETYNVSTFYLIL